MDRIVSWIVRFMARLAGHARILPGVEYAQWQPGEPFKILLVGYNGARNTGSDVRVSALARQIADAFGPGSVEVSVMSLDPAGTSVYFDEHVQQVGFNTLFFGKLLKVCSANHVAILSEGSTFKSKFADALTLYLCEAAGIMRAQNKPCIAYGAEVGEMDELLTKNVRDLCKDVQVMVRSKGSLEAAEKLGLKAHLGTDTAWTFDSSSGRSRALELLRAGGWDGKTPLLGVAPINPFWWPAKPSIGSWLTVRFTGKTWLQFQKWYFMSWSQERAARFEAYLDAMAGAVRAFAAEKGMQPVIFGMERLDADACERFAVRLGMKAPILLARDLDGFVIASALHELTLLATSRYHAQVLAMQAGVPVVAVSMDERLDNIASDLQEYGSIDGRAAVRPALLSHVDDPDLEQRLRTDMGFALEHASDIADSYARYCADARSTLDKMASWLVNTVKEFYGSR